MESLSFDRIYIEITNVCDLQCPFCPPSGRKDKFMSAEALMNIASQISPYTKTAILHLRGEPLLHPQLSEILTILGRAGLCVHITTNATRIAASAQALLEHSDVVSQVSFSLQSLCYSENRAACLLSAVDFAQRFSSLGGSVVFRLWADTPDDWKENIYKLFSEKFGKSPFELRKNARRTILQKQIYFSREDEFTWPQSNTTPPLTGFCYGTLRQLGILSDGVVVPCCLDFKGLEPLGNIFESSFSDIIGGKRFSEIKEGFQKGLAISPLCAACSFRSRFAKKANLLRSAHEATS